MLNSSEEQSYWYLRLNGFFLLDNFVIHKSPGVNYSSDADLLGIRLPFVYEHVGGQPDDWDNTLFQNFQEQANIAVICQVKGGAIGNKPLFQEPYLSYSIHRFGITQDIQPIIDQLTNAPIATYTNELGQVWQVAKLLVTRDNPPANSNYLAIRLDAVYDFINNRIRKYPKEKYNDRNFFSSIGLQTIIEMSEMQNRKEAKQD